MRPTTYILLMNLIKVSNFVFSKTINSVDLLVCVYSVLCTLGNIAPGLGPRRIIQQNGLADLPSFLLFNVDIEMFRLLRNVFEKLVHIVNSPLILTYNGRFSQSVQHPKTFQVDLPCHHTTI
jgi:hypothetical protein